MSIGRRTSYVFVPDEKADSKPESKARLYTEIDMELTRVDGMFLRLLQSGLAGFLEISPDDVRIPSIEEGSVKVTIELPMRSAERLPSAYDRNDPELAGHLAPPVLLDVRQAGPGRLGRIMEIVATGVVGILRGALRQLLPFPWAP